MTNSQCPNCGSELESSLGCSACHSIFPASAADNHYNRLGLVPVYAIDGRELEKRYLKWSRELHPDFFQLRPLTDQEQSLRLSAALNDAYATLKDPFRRAEYLLSLEGGPTASEQREMPEEFFERVLELRMEIEELLQGDRQSPAIGKIRSQLQAERSQAMARIAELFATNVQESPQGEMRIAIRLELNKVKYLDGLLKELSP